MYDHTQWKARHPVRSALVKPLRAWLVVGSVTTSESQVLYVLVSFFLPLRLVYYSAFAYVSPGVESSATLAFLSRHFLGPSC